ncbi:MAG: 1-deoxy-D-xylulose-5-phosphate reductoisomerase [Acidimicrobiales bacterium]|jgi:1-deoxy-D-xylulose-5-phosphate reductoisomerase
MAPSRPRVALLGATGSIGTQTLDVLREQREHFDLVAVSGGQRLAELAVIAKEFSVHSVGVVSERDRDELRALLGPGVQVVVGAEGLAELAARADVVVNAVVGFAGLPVTLSALSAGKRLALANKESLIAAAPLVEKVRRTPGAVILPIDSEHCAIHQCLAGSLEPGHPDVRLLHLTASGGPFRGMTKEQLGRVSKHDALQHPTWTMGPKITVDSSTLMNKGLEVLEASALFGIEVERVNVVVHPQSIVHSMVEYVDGAVLAQLSLPDMRLPIAYCLGEPVRFSHAWGQMDFAHAFSLDFEAPDREAFGALDLAYEASRLGGAAPAWLSAANEIAVEAFLNDQIEWSRIVPLVADVLSQYEPDPLDTLASLFENDATARRLAHAMVPR